MRRLLASLRAWVVPAIFVALAALATIPWTFWVIVAAYERDVNEKSAMLVNRVKIQLQGSWWMQPPQQWWNSPQMIMNQIAGELRTDSTVQCVAFLYVRPSEGMKTSGYGFVRSSESIPVPLSMDDINQLMGADANSFRRYTTWKVNDDLRGVIYLDLSRSELRKHFKDAYWPLLRNVMAMTVTGIVIISAAGMIAFHLWTRAARQRHRSELEQQGLLAERGLAAAVLAHEIRNPLAALRFQLHSLRRNAADPQRVTASADTIDAELLRIQKLVQDYLAHEKAQAVQVAAVELGTAVRNLQSLMGELLRESGTRMIVETGPEEVIVACDPHGLRQVLMNLIINAQQAMGRGGMITVRIWHNDSMGTIAITDTGPGIPEDMRDRLFKPFATSKKEGSGIGLALVKRFADNFGGSVSVESPPGRGATFFLNLPLYRPMQVRKYESPPGEAAVEGAIP